MWDISACLGQNFVIRKYAIDKCVFQASTGNPYSFQIYFSEEFRFILHRSSYSDTEALSINLKTTKMKLNFLFGDDMKYCLLLWCIHTDLVSVIKM